MTVGGTGLTGADAGNYTLTVPSATLADIAERLRTVIAKNAGKISGTPEPALTFTVSGPGLVSGDAFQGSLIRSTGEAPGIYTIEQGSLTAGPNYVIQFNNGTFTILAAEPETPQLELPAILRALPLPSDAGQSNLASSGSLTVDVSAVCPDGDDDCVM